MNTPIPFVAGRNFGLSLPRKFVCDLVHFGKQVPGLAMERRMRLGDVRHARAEWPQHISWCAIFMKAYAIVAADRPELRRAYLAFPWARLYEHPENIAAFSVERQYQGEDSVFCSFVRRPELLSLERLDRLIRAHKTAEIARVDNFQRALNLSRLPRPLRRSLWWLGLNVDGSHRARFFGTFAISVVASLGAASIQLISPNTTALNYGTFEDDGAIDVRVTYDHRVLDGAPVARAMVALEEVLHDQIYHELRNGPRSSSTFVSSPVLSTLSIPSTNAFVGLREAG